MTAVAAPQDKLNPFAIAIAAAALLFVGWASWQLSLRQGDGRLLSFAILAGAAFGILLQRSRFCFFCVTRDFLDGRDPRGLIGIVVALAVGTIGYHAVFGAFLPVPALNRLPPDAHIGPVSWVLALGATVFGVGMAISGSCISAHLYRLGEGALASPFALLGALAGFALGFASWNWLYLTAIQASPVIWLPHHLGYGGSLLLQLALLGALALWLARYDKRDANGESASPLAAIFRRRWPAYVGGLLIGFLGVVAYFRMGALGVTAELGSVARTAANQWALLPPRLEGLDSFAGCATAVKTALLSKNGVFVGGLVLGALAAALVAGDFKPKLPSLSDIARNFLGGVLMGWGAMVAIGCTVGTLLSGVMAGAASGWIFGLFCLIGIWAGWRARQRLVRG
ncbi:MAG: YeeE/YedE family protein [Alphaproteobacteria bacterium]